MEPSITACIRSGLEAVLLDAQRDMFFAEETGNAEAQALAIHKYVDALQELAELEEDQL